MRIATTIVVTILAAAYCCIAKAPLCLAADPSETTPNKAALVRHLRQQESLLNSMECEMTYWREATRDEEIPRIERVLTTRHQEGDLTSFVITGENAESWGGTIRWFRKGQKERIEKNRAGADDVVETKAFDGNVVRQLSSGDRGYPMGSISDITGGHWKSTERRTPFGFLFEFAMQPFSTVLSEGRDFRINPVSSPPGDWAVGFRHSDGLWFRLLVDDQFRIVQRDNIFRFDRNNPPRISQRFQFRDYERFADASGESVWLPKRVDIDLCCGELDGRPVVYTTEHYELNEVAINPDLPDDLFVLSFPEGANVWDDLSGMGWIQQEEASTSAVGPPTDPTARPVSRRWWRVAIVAVGLAAIAAIFVWLKPWQRWT